MPRNRVIAVVVAIGVLAALAAIVWSTMGLAGFTVEVCMDFKGRRQCATASGTTREEAIETARTTACATIAAGVGETIACGNTEPTSVRDVVE